MTSRCRSSRIAFVLLCALIPGVFGKESNQILSKSSLADCLEKCKREVSTMRSGCYLQCLKTNKAAYQQAVPGQIFKQRTRKSLPPVPNCPDSSPNQSVDWAPSEVNVTFGQYENTSHWYANVSWTPLNDSYGHWTGILIRFAIVPSTESGFLFGPVICTVYPKNQTFVNMNITAYDYQFPNAIQMNVTGLPYSSELDKHGALMQRYEPITSSSLPVHVTTKVWTTSGDGPNHAIIYVSIWIGVLVGLAVVAGLLKYFLFSRKYVFSPPEFEYHAFIIYNQEDSCWVTSKLLPLLEEKHHLKCCVHYRDFEPGMPYEESMAESVYKSFKIIAVLSNNFLKSNYCNYELGLAKYRLLNRRDDSLIIIRIDKADYSKLPRKLRKRNFIDYSNSLERPFWEEKLLKFLVNWDNNNIDSDCAISNGNSDRGIFSRLNSTTSNNTEVSTVSSNEEIEMNILGLEDRSIQKPDLN